VSRSSNSGRSLSAAFARSAALEARRKPSHPAGTDFIRQAYGCRQVELQAPVTHGKGPANASSHARGPPRSSTNAGAPIRRRNACAGSLGCVSKEVAEASGDRRPWAAIGPVIGGRWLHGSAPCPDRTSRGRQCPAQRGAIHRLSHGVNVTPATQDAQQRPRLTSVDALDPERNPFGRGTIRVRCRTRLGDGVKHRQPLLGHRTTRIPIRDHRTPRARTTFFLTAHLGQAVDM
jgi:hypothetical protein